jgi:hypothetical protein
MNLANAGMDCQHRDHRLRASFIKRAANITATPSGSYWQGFETTGLSPDEKRPA